MKLWQKIIAQLAPLGGFCFLGLEIYFRLVKGHSLCSTSSCRLVGGFVKTGEFNLVVLGCLFFGLTWLVLFFYSYTSKSWLERLGMWLLAVGLAGDGGLIGFQVFGLGTECQLCFTVAGLLLLSVLGFSLAQKRFFPFVLGASIWLASFSTGYILKYPKLPPKLTELRLISWPVQKKVEYPKAYLFISLRCGHCRNLVNYLAQAKHVDRLNWQILIVDRDKADLHKINYLLQLPQIKTNPFQAIFNLEHGKYGLKKIISNPLEPGLKAKIAKIGVFFRSQHFLGVPLLIVEEFPGKKLILTGTNNILIYLNTHYFSKM